MGLFKKDPKEANYVGGEKHWAEVIENVGYGTDLYSLHPDQDFNTNSTLIVHPGEYAIFEKNGHIQQVFEEGRYQLTTENYPFISRLRNAFTGGVSTFNCRVYFFSSTTTPEITWGGRTQVKDKRLDLESEVFVRGAYRVKVGDPGLFLQTLLGNGYNSFPPETLNNYLENEFQETIMSELTAILEEIEGGLVGVKGRQKQISDSISPQISEKLSNYGIELLKFSIASIEVDLDDELRRNFNAKASNASADLNVMNKLGDKWAAQQQVDIMKAMANNQGTGGIGAGIGMGMAAAGSFFGMGQQMMGQQMGQQPQYQQQPQAAPPPMIQFYLFVNGQQVGPVPLQQMPQYQQAGQLTPDTLVWTPSMGQQWAAAKTVPELQHLFAPQGPPPPPMPPTPPTM